ncbi:di-heme oxidoredictase family protein [Longimicrobium sp.]|uniref:di-heme oxidoredictase family protein n=1 Tax=Longimicrobium sp. TaxID=2029185 RepID=UPI002D0DD298|nr:di-heme oxidoredictase family protein [Longimicrobium sp.]HSU16105.1 di-heme oxidoredictase family protein [Longimicrobium sp.]
MRRAAQVPLTLLFGLLVAACVDDRKGPSPTSTLVVPEGPAHAASAAGTTLGQPISGLTLAQLAAFNRGKVLFDKTFSQTNGLGPIFNASSCSECHGEDDGVLGGTGDEVETHFTNVRSDGSCDLLTAKGGFVHQDSVTPKLFAATGLTSEPFPTVTHARGSRTVPDLFGFGLIAAIPNAAIVNQEDPYDYNYDGISGRAHYTSAGDIGKFGHKANEGSVTLFNAGALLNEMGITNKFNLAENNIGGMPIPFGVDPAPEPEISGTDFDDLNSFVIFLAPPPTVPLTTQSASGRDLFNSIGCAGCHTAQYTTTDVGIAALSYRTVRPFSDFLLHDMGAENVDICLDQARTREFRTEPLMGARFMEVFMHDGRASTIQEAVAAHGGEGANARTRFRNLTLTQQAAVVAYVNSL